MTRNPKLLKCPEHLIAIIAFTYGTQRKLLLQSLYTCSASLKQTAEKGRTQFFTYKKQRKRLQPDVYQSKKGTVKKEKVKTKEKCQVR